jgi:hypothetical protein
MTPNELILAGGFALLAAVCLIWALVQHARANGLKAGSDYWYEVAGRRLTMICDQNIELTELRAFKANQGDIRQRANAKKRADRAAKSA